MVTPSSGIVAPAARRAHQPNGQGRTQPLVVAHRGSPALLPEHTLAGFRAAARAGADVLEVDVLPCADGVLVARHDPTLGATTDVADRPDLAHRGRGSGREKDWWLVDLPSSVVTGLRARERWPALRPASAAHDGLLPVPRLTEVLRLAGDEAAGRGRPLGVAVELKHVADARRAGLDVVQTLLADLAATGLPSARVPVWVLAEESEPLVALAARRGRSAPGQLALVQLVEQPHAWSLPGWARRGDGVGPGLDLVLPLVDDRADPGRVAAAHRAGLEVWAWTFQAENAGLPPSLQRGTQPSDHGDLAALVRQARQVGIDALVTDHAGLLVSLES
jgi:glycerophosphoryl diester phosphodiesterase